MLRPIGCDTPPLSERFPPWRACEVEVRYPPPIKRGISAIPARYPMKTRQMGAIPPSAIPSRKGIARYGGVSRTGPLRLALPSRMSPCLCDSPRKIKKGQTRSVIMWSVVLQQSPQKSDLCGHQCPLHLCQSTCSFR